MKTFLQSIKVLYNYRDLLFAWAYRIIRGRYQQSILGSLWAIIVPVTQTAIFSLIFTFFIPVDTGQVPYLVFSYTAMVPWTLFSSSLTDMVESLVGNFNLVSKIYFPREILPLSALTARLVDFFIAYGILAILMQIYRIQVNIPGLLYLPVILIIQLILSLGLGLLGSALNVFYRDIRHLFILGLQIWFYASPIIYPVSAVPEEYQLLYFLNPMAGIIEAYRDILLNQQIPNPYLGLSALVTLLVLGFGYWFFKRVEFQFADVI